MPRKKRVNKLYSLDTETIGLDGDIKRIALYDGETITYGYTFEDVEPVLDAAYKAGFMPHIYIHNLEFDARKMPRIFERGNVNWNTTVLINDKYARITCRHYVIHDSFKILPMALSKLSKDFDLEHGKLDLWDEVQKKYPDQYLNHVDFLSRCSPDDPLYLRYLGYDVMSLYELIEKLMEVSGLDLEAMIGRVSTASLAKYLFKNGYKGNDFRTGKNRRTDYEILTQCKGWNSKKPFPGDSNYTWLEIESKIRNGYYGGRTEVFTPRIMGGRAYHLDINSMYPASMLGHDYPVGMPDYYEKPLLCENVWTMWINDHVGLGYITATVYIPAQHIPPLPVKMGKLVFPTGMVRGTWTFTELEYAVKNCGVEIREYHEVIYFKKTFKVFDNFVGTFYTLKEEGKRSGNASLTAFAKLILNCSYGYLCLSREGKSELRNIDKKEKYEDRIIYEDEELGFINIESVVQSESIQVAAGAYVTSYARLILLDALRKQDEKGAVYYCDTDSIVCAAPMAKNMMDKYELGKWDLEGVLSDGIFLFPKVYAEIIDEKASIKFKGVSRETQKTMNFDFYEHTLKKLQRGEQDRILVEKGKAMLRGLLYTQKKGINPNTLEYRDKTINLANVQKRNIDYAANCSMPWHFETLEEFHGFSFAAPVRKWKDYGNLYDPLS